MMRYLERDGAALWFDDEGEGDPPLLFVHGFACDHTHFAPQIDRFAPRHRVVAVDLRGHGRSGAPQQEYTIEGYADDLAFLCRQLGLARPVVVGHSMGGLVTAVLGRRHPEVPGGLMILDSAVVPKPVLLEGLVGWADEMRAVDYAERLVGVSDAFFLPSSDPGLKQRIQGGMWAPQHVLVSSAEHMATFVAAAAAGGDADLVASWTVPVCYVAGPWHMNDVERFVALRPDVVMGQTVGSGHYVTLEVPDQIGAMIERFLELVSAGCPGR